MSIYLVTTGGGDDGDTHLCLDLSAPITVQTETVAPFRLALRAKSPAVASDQSKSVDVLVRFSREEALLLRDRLESALANVAAAAPLLIKRTQLGVPLNGGVNRENGNMVLEFDGLPGARHHLEIPYDQSGMTSEILQRASEAAATWQDERFEDDPGPLKPIKLQARPAEFILVGHDPVSDLPVLIVRLDGGHQFSFALDRKMLEQIRYSGSLRSEEYHAPVDPLGTVAEDIEWFAKHWCRLHEAPTDTEIRHGIAALRRLLLEDALGSAWRHVGFTKQPTIRAPDLDALLDHKGIAAQHVVSLIVGGATVNGLQHALIGVRRIDHPKTGVPADAESGFAVEVFNISRDARSPSTDVGMSDLTDQEQTLSTFLKKPGAVRTGALITRRQIITYFASQVGGVHIDGIGQRRRRSNAAPDPAHVLLQDLQNKVQVDVMEGLYFAVLSMGQAIGRSDDLQKLARAIRDRSSAVAQK